jgi:CRISPR-associated endoribonuclease Cas6
VTALNGRGEGVQIYDGASKALGSDVRPQTIRNVLSPAFDLQLSTLDLHFLTPTRLIFDRQLVTVPEFHILIRNLLRRLSNLAYFHCDSELDLDFRGLVDAAQEVKLVENRTRWHDWERYSARQDAKLKMGGVIGEAVYRGDLAPFIPLLTLGEVLHVGKGTGLGLGRFRASTLCSLARAAAGEGGGEGSSNECRRAGAVSR